MKPNRSILYHFQKRFVVKVIQYKNRVKLFVLNGNKRTIRYEAHNGLKPNRYNGNIAYITHIHILHIDLDKLMSIGRAQARKFFLAKKKKLLDLQIYSQIGKTMKKLTPMHLWYFDVYIWWYQNCFIYSWIGKHLIDCMR